LLRFFHVSGSRQTKRFMTGSSKLRYQFHHQLSEKVITGKSKFEP